MSDEQKRELERRIQAGDPEAQQDMLRYRARIGEIQVKEYGGKLYELQPWTRSRTDVYGNNRACNCPELMRVVGLFCVCYGICYCPNCGHGGCVGGHD